MATHLSTASWNILARLGFSAEYDLEDGDDTKDKKTVSIAPSWDFGSDAEEADLVWHDLRTIAASADDDIDLGALTDRFGQTLVFANVKAILIWNRTDEATTAPAHTATTADVQVGGAAANAFEAWVAAAGDIVGPFPEGGGCLLINPEGWTVTADTGDILRVTNNDGANEALIEIVIIGDSA